MCQRAKAMAPGREPTVGLSPQSTGRLWGTGGESLSEAPDSHLRSTVAPFQARHWPSIQEHRLNNLSKVRQTDS